MPNGEKLPRFAPLRIEAYGIDQFGFWILPDNTFIRLEADEEHQDIMRYPQAIDLELFPPELREERRYFEQWGKQKRSLRTMKARLDIVGTLSRYGWVRGYVLLPTAQYPHRVLLHAHEGRDMLRGLEQFISQVQLGQDWQWILQLGAPRAEAKVRTRGLRDAMERLEEIEESVGFTRPKRHQWD